MQLIGSIFTVWILATSCKQQRAVRKKEMNAERQVPLRNKYMPTITRSSLFRLLLNDKYVIWISIIKCDLVISLHFRATNLKGIDMCEIDTQI